MNRFTRLAAALVLAATPALGQAQIVLYSDNFDGGMSGASWMTNSTAAGSDANYAFDYSTIGIPSAPNSTGGSTIGLQMRVNRPGTGIFSGISASPMGQSFTGDYTLRFDAWQNFNGPFPAGGNGSTQVTTGGIGARTNVAQFPGSSVDGVLFGATGDGGSANDYRAYANPGSPFADTSGVYAAGNTAGASNNSNAYYNTNLFGNVAAPAAQVGLFSQQTGNTAAGTAGMEWHTWTVEKQANLVRWYLRNRIGVDVLIATVDVTSETFAGDNLFLGLFDTNAGSSTDPNADSLLFALFDNVQVSTVPEPTSMALAGFGALAFIRYRRRKA